MRLPTLKGSNQRFKQTISTGPRLPIKRRKSSRRTRPNWVQRETRFGSWISSKQLMAASVHRATAKNYRAAGEMFYNFIKQKRRTNPTLPTLETMLSDLDLANLDSLMQEFVTYKFNRTANSGATLRHNASGILYCLAVDFGVVINAALLPGVGKHCTGADNILRELRGDQEKGKRAILNPILEAMLKHATDREKFALLVAQRFCLRSQHYCNNRKKREQGYETAQYIKNKHFQFIPDIRNPRAVTLNTGKDKNHQQVFHMERTVHCSCNTDWSCIVHTAQAWLRNKLLPPDQALLQGRNGDMTFSSMMCIIKTLIAKIGLNPDNYGTHSCRSGGTTEFFLEQRSGLWIQNFGGWKNLGSVQVYIKPNNPDLKKFVNSTVEYTEQREKEGRGSSKPFKGE